MCLISFDTSSSLFCSVLRLEIPVTVILHASAGFPFVQTSIIQAIAEFLLRRQYFNEPWWTPCRDPLECPETGCFVHVSSSKLSSCALGLLISVVIAYRRLTNTDFRKVGVLRSDFVFVGLGTIYNIKGMFVFVFIYMVMFNFK